MWNLFATKPRGVRFVGLLYIGGSEFRETIGDRQVS